MLPPARAVLYLEAERLAVLFKSWVEGEGKRGDWLLKVALPAVVEPSGIEPCEALGFIWSSE